MKRQSVIKTISLLHAALIFLSSCDPLYDPYPGVVPEDRQKENIYYLLTSPNAPLLRYKDEVNVRINYITGKKHSGGEIQMAYKPSDRLSLNSRVLRGCLNFRLRKKKGNRVCT